MNTEKFVKKMSDGNENIIHAWIPDGSVKGVVVLSHGMAEYAMRYDYFGKLLSNEGYAFYAEDHRGHGETAEMAKKNGTGGFGYLADKNGFLRVVDDIHEEVLDLKEKYHGKKIVLFGHSFGSFVSQCYCEKYGDSIDGCILCGTAGPREALVHFARGMASVIKFFTGKKHVSKFMDGIAFGSYNSKIKNPRTSSDWLSRDEENVDKYVADKWCGFTCTIGFFYDMFNGLCIIHEKKNMDSIPKNLPIYFIDGTGDPVGSYGQSVKSLYDIYLANGMKNVKVKFYEGARHELLNETNHAEVENDIITWVKEL